MSILFGVVLLFLQKTKFMEFKKLKTIGNWVNRTEVMEFFNYKPTQMHKFMQDYGHILITSRIGRRCFFNVKSVEKILDIHQESFSR